MTTPGRYFCAESARERGDRLYGTAPRVESWLMVEQIAPWSAKAFPDDRLLPAVREYIQQMAQALPRTRRLVVRQGYGPSECSRFFVARSSEDQSHIACVTTFCREDLLAVDARALWEQPGPQAWTKPMFLVCTHGKHDKCCGRFGFATFRALSEAAPDAAWECSHVGGDRFAANVIVLPQGIYYGHVQPEDTSALVAAHTAGHISLRHYRGRTCYGRAAQAGEYFIRRETGLNGIDDLRLTAEDELDAHVSRVRFEARADGRVYEVELRARQSAARGLMTCAAERPESSREYELRAYRTAAASVAPAWDGGS